MNFELMIQVLIKRFGRSTDKRIEENSNEAFANILQYCINASKMKTDMEE